MVDHTWNQIGNNLQVLSLSTGVLNLVENRHGYGSLGTVQHTAGTCNEVKCKLEMYKG